LANGEVMALPKLSAESSCRLDILMDLFFKQLMTFSESINEAPDKIPSEKFADFVLYALKKELHKVMDEKGIKYPALDGCAYFPPPWNPDEFPEKTKGWIEFQKCLKDDINYYLGIFH
jgi:hypothetical protein